MSQLVFADSFYYLALINPRDVSHERAVAFSSRANMRVLTSAWVIQELADGLAAAAQRGTFLRLYDAIRNDIHTEIIVPSEDTWNGGLRLYRARRDKDWSLTDCISFGIMTERGVTEALSGDRHFRQAGFVPLLADG